MYSFILKKNKINLFVLQEMEETVRGPHPAGQFLRGTFPQPERLRQQEAEQETCQ